MVYLEDNATKVLSILTNNISSICPIDGISLDGTIFFKDSATDIQKLAAKTMFDNFNFNMTIVPDFVSNYQGRAALIQANLFQQVDQAVQSLGNTSMEYQAWEYATNFYRNSPFIISLGTQLGLTSDQIDQLFIAANNIS